ncbi:MAG: squalene/phytoene synthase family protein, partial [Gemmatimonadota bacterium]|nr:squalene/phytoene synthase family protein [Gemmatimonadota bacterium]
GELAQARATGRMLDFEEYASIARGKSGELLGCALAIGPLLRDPARTAEYHELGCRVGLVYQMLDDLLDLTAETDCGKPALADYVQGHWTWPLAELGVDTFGIKTSVLLDAFHGNIGSESGIRRCLQRYDCEVDKVTTAAEAELGDNPIIGSLLEGWRARATEAVDREEICARRPDPRPPSSETLIMRVARASDEIAYLAHHSRSFRFATRFFPSPDEARVARVYAYCRITDDLVDDADTDFVSRGRMLDEWIALSRRAYDGAKSGIPFLDEVMWEMADARVPFTYAAELTDGMRMDLRGERYASLAELRRYTYRVASVVGLWISELFDVRDPAVLRRAECMGHAMQLTNILRDVGADLALGRCYLPADLMRKHDVTEAQLRTGLKPSGYPALMEEMMCAAEDSYRLGFEGIPRLPFALRFPVSVAAHVYRGILDEIRDLDYDNLTRRATTSGSRKALLAARALVDLRPRLRRDRGVNVGVLTSRGSV